MIDHQIEDVLPDVHVPVRVVRGGADLILQPGWARTVATIARAPRPTAVPRWGHAVHYDSPRPVARVVRRLVEEVDPPDGR